MECPNCGCELHFSSSFGNRDYIVYGDQSGKVGEIFECPNHDGFEDDPNEAQKYLEKRGETLESLGLTSIEEVVCENGQGGRHYYTDKSGYLHEGYPC